MCGRAHLVALGEPAASRRGVLVAQQVPGQLERAEAAARERLGEGVEGRGLGPAPGRAQSSQVGEHRVPLGLVGGGRVEQLGRRPRYELTHQAVARLRVDPRLIPE
jgi:hypothetical protein